MIDRLREANPLVLGLITSAVIAALVAGALAVGTLGFGQARYTAEFAHAADIRAGDEVRIAGIGVGEVTGARLAGDRVVVSFRVENDVHLGSRTGATIKVSTLLGGRYLELRPDGADELADNRIPLVNTTVPFDLADVLETGTLELEALDGDALRTALAAVRDNLRGTGPQVGAALDGLSRLSAVIDTRKDQISDLITSADAVSAVLSERRGQLFTLLGQSDALLGELLRRRELIRGTLDDFAEFTGQLRALLEENRAQIEPLLDNVVGVTDILRRADESIDRALKLLAPAGRYLNNAAGNGPYLDLYLPYGLFPDNFLCRVGAVSGCR